jgi:hypothetical protein
VVDGVNVVFTVANSYATGSTAMFRNGLRGQRGYDFNETPPDRITFTDAPFAGDLITVDYFVGS